MKLGTLRGPGRDGRLAVISSDLKRAAPVPHIALTMQQALDHWREVVVALRQISERLAADHRYGAPLDLRMLAAPLPRAYQWLDGSAYLSHVERVRKARGATMPPEFYREPLMYQGGSDAMLAATDPICVENEEWGIDLEAEVAVITDDVPCGCAVERAAGHIQLLVLVNDVSLRHLIPPELAKGFGFLQSKPPTAFSPVAVTPDELGAAWRDGKLHRPLHAWVNESLLGSPDAGADMQFNFAQLIRHAARTRPLSAGTIIGSGTVSNDDLSRGVCCLAELRILEKLASGEARTPFLRYGDRVRIDMKDESGASVFGAIDQQVQPWRA